ACYDSATGKYWNQRIMIQPSSMPSAPTHHLYNYLDFFERIHLGNATRPFYFEARLTADFQSQDWTDDWSQQTSAVVVSGPDRMMYPISPDWTDGNSATAGVIVNKVNRHACETTTTNIVNILVEEWDGYTWKRVFGNGPLSNLKTSGVAIIDSLPAYLTFDDFITTAGSCSYNNGNRTIQCDIGDFNVNHNGQIQYRVVAQDPGCPSDDINLENVAWIRGDNQQTVSDNVKITLKCDVLATPTSIYSDTPINTATQTPTPSYSETNTPSLTYTITQTSQITFTFTPTSTFTLLLTNTFTQTPSLTITMTSVVTYTSTQTPATIFSPSLTYTHVPDENGEPEIREISVYPNPVNPEKDDLNILLIVNKQIKTVNVKIYTRVYKLIREIVKNGNEITNNTIKIENSYFKNFANGIYWVVVIVKDENNKTVNSHIQQIIILHKKK
ncbi:MAG TPA: hypothetical protein PLF61_05680, partial [Candidatus Goldiibacteriota bacterium]|nr:hypothetical protein [Candidatus Goldiibacteriota bacterium]